MVHVPMDKSGLDHDFFIQKYEPAVSTGSYTNTAGTSTFPSVIDGLNNWVSTSAECHENYLRTGNLSLALCGNGTIMNGTTAVLTSVSTRTVGGGSPDHGASWKACRNTNLLDGSLHSYGLRMTSGSEYRKASDWGDLNHDDIIDVSSYSSSLNTDINLNAFVSEIESWVTADTTTTRCHSDASPAGAYPNNATQTENCQSRYGMRNPAGNSWAYTNERLLNASGLDNGIDGLVLGHPHANTGNVGGMSAASVDLLRGMVRPNSAPRHMWRVGATLNRIWGSGATTERSYILSGDEDAAGRNAGRWPTWVQDGMGRTNPSYLVPRCVLGD